MEQQRVSGGVVCGHDFLDAEGDKVNRPCAGPEMPWVQGRTAAAITDVGESQRGLFLAAALFPQSSLWQSRARANTE